MYITTQNEHKQLKSDLAVSYNIKTERVYSQEVNKEGSK